MPGFPVHHQLLEFTQTHVHRVGDAIQPSQPLSSPSPAFNLSHHQGFSQWFSSSNQGESLGRNSGCQLLLKCELLHYLDLANNTFLIVIYGCESWTIKKAECQKIDSFELGCWGRLLKVPWTARRSNQSILKEISPEYSLEGLMLKLKLQYFGHLMQKTDSLEKTLILEKIEGWRRRGQEWDGWMASLTQWTWVWVNSDSRCWTGKPAVLQSMG